MMVCDLQTSSPGRRRLLATGLVAAAVSLIAASAADETPRIPGAVTACPPWLKKGAPFDVEKFFAMPPEGKNAAPLYLDAFAEFSPEVATCLPASEKRRGDVARDRAKRLEALHRNLGDKSASLDRKAADAMLAELHDGFRKLEAAQRRTECVFAIGISWDAILPHLQPAREVVRATHLRIFRDVEKGDLKRPIQDVAAMLRMSRDIRPRGPMIAQVLSSTIDGMICQELLPIILGSPALKVEDCDRLLALLREHDAAAVDRFATGAKGEYVSRRTLLHAFQDKRGTKGGKDGQPVDAALTSADLSKLLAEMSEQMNASGAGAPAGGVDAFRAAEAELRGHGASWAKERRAIDDDYLAMSSPEVRVYSERIRRLEAFKKANLGGKGPGALWLTLLINPNASLVALSTTRGDTFIRAAECVAAARRWQLAHAGADPTDLGLACKAAKLPDVPIDPFSDAPLKLAVVAGKPVVYSIGPDGVDDRGLKDSNFAREPDGDVLFHVPAAKK